MTIDFYNKNVANAKFKICWGINQCTPVFSLKEGAIGNYDLSFSHQIRSGTQCFVYACHGSAEDFSKGVTFTYEHGKKTNDTFNYYMDELTNHPILSLSN